MAEDSKPLGFGIERAKPMEVTATNVSLHSSAWPASQAPPQRHYVMDPGMVQGISPSIFNYPDFSPPWKVSVQFWFGGVVYAVIVPVFCLAPGIVLLTKER